MYKKWIALLLAVALLCSVMPQASAARIENRIALGRYAFTSDDNVYREFTNSGAMCITMAPGEWLVTPAFHAVDGWVASYSGMSAVSSDPDVAEARVVFVGASPVAGIANSFIGLEVHAKQPGTAQITVRYSAFITNSKYEDMRGSPNYTKQFTVTVTGQSLEMDVAMSTSGVCWDWPEGYREAQDYYNEGMAEANELLASKMLIDGLTAAITGGTMALGYGAAVALGATMFIPGAALGMAVTVLGLSVGLAVRTQMGLAKGNKNAVKDAADATIGDIRNMVLEDSVNKMLPDGIISVPVGNLLDAADIANAYVDANVNTWLRERAYPTATPFKASVMIRLTNNSSWDINAELDLSSENLSFTSVYGPWADSSSAGNQPVTVPAGGSITVPVMVYPKPGFHTTESGVSELIHTGTVAVQCNYFDPGLGSNVTLDGGAELPVYSKLNKQDQVKAAQALLKKDNQRGTYVMCPVDVHILDKTGKTLGVLTTDGEDYRDEFITAGSVGDMKFFMIPQDKKADYQLKIVAVEDGTMHVLGMDGSEATNLSAYTDVPLKKGDEFFLDLSEAEPAALYTLSGEGEREPVEAALQINEKEIAAKLEQTDISEENRSTVAHAMARALIPATVHRASYQSEVTLEQMAQLMLHLCEKQLGLFPGKLTELYLSENPQAQPVSMPVAVAAWKGLLSREYGAAAYEKDAASRLLTMEEMQLMHDGFRDMMELPETVDFRPDALTLEKMICMADSLWKAKAVEGKNVERTCALTEKLRSELTESTNFEDYVIYYRPDGQLTQPLRELMIYEPFAISPIMQQGQNQDDLMERLALLIMMQRRQGPDDAEMIDMDAMNRPNLTIGVGLLGSGFEVTDGQNWQYSWAPFYFTTQYGSIYHNEVYLAVYRGYDEADLSIYGRRDHQENHSSRMECYIITDQKTVGSFLAEQYLLNEAVTASYPPLGPGSTGDAVYKMQQRLFNSGYLEEEPTGEFDEQTSQAVRKIQTDLRQTPTGVADERLQRMIAGEMSMWDVPVEDWLKPYLEKAERENLLP